MKKVRRILFAAFTMMLASLLSGCKLMLLDPQGPIASGEKHILVISTLLMLTIVVPVILLVFAVGWRYRASNTKAVYAPEWSHSTILEIIWWAIPCIIIGILSVITWITSHTYDPYKPIASDAKTLTIEAISLQWKWLFIYPDQNIATVNYIEIPVGVPVRFIISAEGPMNSFDIPQLAGQIYAMAGMQTKLNLLANTQGVYQGFSTNFTGDGFSDMQFSVKADTQDQFDAWVNTVKQSPDKLSMLAYNQLIQPSEKDPVKYYSDANKDIFETVVMKSMMPMPMRG